jgi:hypothetical protein
VSYHTPMGLAITGTKLNVTASGMVTNTGRQTTSAPKQPKSLPLPSYRYINRRGKKMDAEYLIFRVPPWTELKVAQDVAKLEREMGLQAADDAWKKRDERKSDVPAGTVVMQRYVPKNSMGRTAKVSQAELDATPPLHIYNRRPGKDADADFLQFRSPPWTDELIKRTSFDEWARRVGIPTGGRGDWFKREKSDVPAGHIVYQSYTKKRIGTPGGDDPAAPNQAYDSAGNPLGPSAPPYTQNEPMFPGIPDTWLYIGAAAAAVGIGLLIKRRK